MSRTHPVLSRFERLAALTAPERSALRDLPFAVEEVLVGEGIAWAGEPRFRCTLLLEGVLGTSKVVADGRVQITGFHIPGDMPDLHGLHFGALDADIGAVTDCRVAYVPHQALHRLAAEHPRIGALLWRITVLDAAIAQEWVANVGRRDAAGRLAHLFCEFLARMEAAGLARDGEGALALTQRDLSEATGLSVPHVGRALQELRARGLVAFGQGRLAVHDREGLTRVGDFRADYLHLRVA